MAEKKQQVKEYVLDAEGKKLGRLSTEIATILRGKNEPSFQAHTYPQVRVVVKNVSKILIPSSHLKKMYKSYSGYPGGLKEETMEHLIERRGYKVIVEKAVRGMLPNNKLRDKMMKNLIIEE